MIKVIIFDLGKVLLDFNNYLIAQRLENLSGRPGDEIFQFIFRTRLETSFDRGEITAEEFLRRINGHLAVSLGLKEFIPLWSDIFTPVTGMKELVTQLKNSGYKIGILSNTNILHFEYVRKRYEVVREITNYHLSYEMHLQKPEEAIYRKVLDYYDCRPEEMAYADDIEPYVSAAKQLGIHAFRFTGAEQLKKDFRGIGIDIPATVQGSS